MATRASPLLPIQSGFGGCEPTHERDHASAARHALALVVFAILMTFFLSPSRTPAPPSTGQLAPSNPSPMALSEAGRATFGDDDPTAPAACGTFRAVESSDAVRIAGRKLFHVDETTGLSIVDLTDIERPRLLGGSAFVGMPLALYVQHGIAWVAFVDWDSAPSGSRTVLRAVDARAEPPRSLGEVVLPGVARDVQSSGDVLFVLRTDDPREGRVLSFALREGTLTKIDEARVLGAPERIVVSPYGLAVMGTRASSTEVSWLELPLEGLPGTMTPTASLEVPGALPRAERRSQYWASVDEDGLVRLVTCASDECGSATLRSLDFGGSVSRARVRGALGLGAVSLARFADGKLYLAHSEGNATSLRVVDTTRPEAPRVVGRTRLDGAAKTVVPLSERLVVLGTLADEAKRRLVVQSVDLAAQESPKVVTKAVFGDDATWSPAESSDAALSTDSHAEVVALPYVTWHPRDGVLEHATALASLRASRPAAVTMPFETTTNWGSRAVVDQGRLLAVGPDGVRAIGRGVEEELSR
ncbi:hypothetical protein AKJ09_11170 [Labilithrix luteola]|uniref:Uncharacterized protein n=1 Tax=Labilithrix luteola TaxID=1391654 RepID=A0A0K1QFS1_9BACT|nr:hypothetical protein [Labilithrix luteola]AKV04507.1 hypothetical protein AKJ09_11170 [Labilithrix luteola]